MYEECEAYLLRQLRDAGIRCKPCRSRKELESKLDSHTAAILHGATELQRGDGESVRYTGADGTPMRRETVWRRTIEYDVIIGDNSPAELERIYTAFLRGLAPGIMIDGDYTPIEAGEAEWATEGDSILKAKQAVRQPVRFAGRICKDIPLVRPGEATITTERSETDGK